MNISKVTILLLLVLCVYAEDNPIIGKWAPDREGIIRINFANGADELPENAKKIESMMKTYIEFGKEELMLDGKVIGKYVILDQEESKLGYRCVLKITDVNKFLGYVVVSYSHGELITYGESSKIGVFRKQ